MESLESKLDRLSPEERKEVENFVEFLLSRSWHPGLPTAAVSTAQVTDIAPPLLTPEEPLNTTGQQPAIVQDTGHSGGLTSPSGRDTTEPAPFQEIDGGIRDRLTSDYMDYGKFDPQSSPATEAVLKIRRKINTREGQDKPHHLLDWVD